MNQKFVVSHLDEQMGPFDESELKAKWLKGDLLPIDYIYDESKRDWILFSERFAWATALSDMGSPPPLRDAALKKKRPPEPPSRANAETPVVVPPSELQKSEPPPAGTQIKMVNGFGEVDLTPLQPGNVELVLQDTATGMLKLQNPLKINVRPAEPHAVEWQLSPQQIVGQDVEVQVRTLDRFGLVCSHYEDTFIIRVNGAGGPEIPVPVKNGVAVVKLQNTKAENWRLSFHYAGSRVLKLPEDKALEWQPGPATKLILDGPQEYIAGHPLKVQVKAVDHFGNLAKTYQGTVVLEVKAS